MSASGTRGCATFTGDAKRPSPAISYIDRGRFRFKALDVSSFQLRDLAVRFDRRHAVLASALTTMSPARPEPLAAVLPLPTCCSSFVSYAPLDPPSMGKFFQSGG